MNLDILGFADGSLNFNCGTVYLVSYSNRNPIPYKYQLVGTCSKLEHSGDPSDSLDIILKRKLMQ